MITRTMFNEIEKSVQSKPVTLITGARQVGKSTLASLFVKERGFRYVSLDDSREREMALRDPDLFLSLHPWPLIIDEVQRAPGLFEAIEAVVNKEKLANEKNYGMYILTGSQIYKLMRGVSQSMSGRVSILHMPPLSRSEILGREEPVFPFEVKAVQARANQNGMAPKELFDWIVKGFYPELFSNPMLTRERFYADYVETYIERDVSELINVKDKLLFRRFMELLASLTGQELIYDNIAKLIGVDRKTVVAWVSVLLAGDIVYLLEPYHETSIAKRIVKRPKIYFSDTGLAAYLARLDNPDVLQASAFSGRFVETYIVNELRKSFLNHGLSPDFYYYRDVQGNEIDLVALHDGRLHRIECKSGMRYSLSDIKAFRQLDASLYPVGFQGILCTADAAYPLGDDAFALPLSGI